MGFLDGDDSEMPGREHLIQLGPGQNEDFDLDELNAYLERGQEDDKAPEPKDDKARAVAVPHIAVYNQAKMRKDEANELLKASKFEEALLKYHRGIWLLMDGEDNFTGERKGVTTANIGKGQGTNHFANAELHLREEVKSLRIALHSNMSLCALKLKKFREAKMLAEFVVNCEIQNVKALYRLAQACEGLGEWRRGLDTLRVLLDLEPENAAAKDMQIRMAREAKKEEKKERKNYAGMFDRMSKEVKEGEELYKAEDVKAESERTRAAQRKKEIAQGPRRWVLNLPEMNQEERAEASRRFQTASEGEDVSKMCEGLPKESIDKIKEKFAAGVAKDEIERLAYCESLCLQLFTPDAQRKLREMLAEGPDPTELCQAACRLAIEDSSFLEEDDLKEALMFVHDGKFKDAWDLLKKKRGEFQFDLQLTMLPPEEASLLKQLKELEDSGAPAEEVDPIGEKVMEMKEARIRRSLTEKGLRELKELEDKGASKKELQHFFLACDKGFFDEVMATKFKDFKQTFQKIVAAVGRQELEREAAEASNDVQQATDSSSSAQSPTDQ